MSETLLKVTGLKVAYGGIQAVKGVDFEVRSGELVTLIGSNGAGKTTTMKAITGTLAINEGDIHYHANHSHNCARTNRRSGRARPVRCGHRS